MTEISKLWHLKQINLFRGLTKKELDYLNKTTKMQEISPKKAIYFLDDPADTVYFLKKGKVKLVKVSPEGGEIIMDVISPGEVFGELALVDDGGREEMALAINDCLLCSIPKDKFIEIIENHPRLNLKLMKLIGLRLRKFSSRLENLIFRDARHRLFFLLRDLIEKYGQENKNEIFIECFLTHREIGGLIAVQRQTVTTLMNDLKNEGIIDFNRKNIIIRDPEMFYKQLTP